MRSRAARPDHPFDEQSEASRPSRQVPATTPHEGQFRSRSDPSNAPDEIFTVPQMGPQSNERAITACSTAVPLVRSETKAGPRLGGAIADHRLAQRRGAELPRVRGRHLKCRALVRVGGVVRERVE
jgi:hypothetical protein